MNNELLPEYQKYLSAKNLVQDQYIIYYAYWASKFLIFSNNNKELNNDLQIEKFIYHLESTMQNTFTPGAFYERDAKKG
jgi:hypothetical protein